MAIQEKVTQEDLIFYEIMRNPVLCNEFIQNVDKTDYDEPFKFTYYQREMLCDFNSYVSFCTARAVGKTVSLVSLITWALVYNVFPSDYILYTVPSKVHLEPVWTGLIMIFRSNSLLKHFIATSSGINSSEFKISLLNQTTLICRIAGQTGTGANLIGLHTPFILLDEAGYFPWNAYQEMQPSLNTWTAGFREMVAGVPTGLRESNVLYSADQENSNYSKHRVSADDNPRLSDTDKQRAIEQYGGEDSDDYMHYWKGVHGKPIFSLFDRSNFAMSNDQVYKLVINGMEYKDNLSEYVTRLNIFPGLNDRSHRTIIGIDLGYTEPTAIVVMYLDNSNRLHFHGRIQLSKVSYPIQEKLIDLLDTKFQPILIGMDKGNIGMSTIHHLQEDQDYIHKNYVKRLIPIDFSSSITLGMDNDGNEIKSKTKPFAVSVLQDYANNHKLMFSYTDLEMVSELERMTYSKTPTGEVIYKTLTMRGGKRGEDHFTSALLCAITAYYLQNEYIQSKAVSRRLFRPNWFIGM